MTNEIIRNMSNHEKLYIAVAEGEPIPVAQVKAELQSDPNDPGLVAARHIQKGVSYEEEIDRIQKKLAIGIEMVGGKRNPREVPLSARKIEFLQTRLSILQECLSGRFYRQRK